MKQSGVLLLDDSVARNTPVEQEIVLRDGDYASIANATEIIVHWFVDCVYVQRSKELSSVYAFADANRTHQIEALLEITPETEPAKDIPALKSRLISDWQTTHQPRLPFVCSNKSAIAGDPQKIYGHFTKNVTVFGRAATIISCILFRQFSLLLFALYTEIAPSLSLLI